MPSVEAAIQAMDTACRVWSVGYDQSNREDVRDGGETDCSALVIWALRQGGFDVGGASYTGNMSAALTARGWVRLPARLQDARPGDILLNDSHHVCMVISGHGLGARIAQASIDERGRATGGRAGDQTGAETNERRIYTYRHGWSCILRYTGAQTSQEWSGRLDVDGQGGHNTVYMLEQAFGVQCGETAFNAVLSGQARPDAAAIPAFNAVEYGDGGSDTVRRVQAWAGVDPDGYWGVKTSRAVQAKLASIGYDVGPSGADGSFGPDSMRALQRALNDGAFSIGWQRGSKGWWYALGGGQYATGWRLIAGRWYHFDGSGWMQVGWVSVSGRWYHLDGSGAMDTGWLRDGDRWYYLDGSGAMLTGWQMIGSRWYCLGSSGARLTGWVVDGDGVSWIYLDSDGHEVMDTVMEIGGRLYAFDAHGRMMTGTVTLVADGSGALSIKGGDDAA